MKRKGVEHHENDDEILENVEVDQLDAEQSDTEDIEEDGETQLGEDLRDDVSEVQDVSDVDVSDSEADTVIRDLRFARTLERNTNARPKLLVTELQEEGYLTE